MTEIKTTNSHNSIDTFTTPILARLMSKDHLHAGEIEKEGDTARRLSNSLFYQTNVSFFAQLARRLRYLETMTDWDVFGTATTPDYYSIECCVERALVCTRDRSIDEVLDRRYTFDDERHNVSYGQILIGLCVIGIASRQIDRAELDLDKWDRRFESLFKMAYLIARESSCFVKYSAQYTDGETLGSRCAIDAADLKERFERLHMYLHEELTED